MRSERLRRVAIALRQQEEKESPMTGPLAHFTKSKLALSVLLCAVALGGTIFFGRSYFYSAPHAAEISAIGHTGELSPVW
jgi:hypothetical protein